MRELGRMEQALLKFFASVAEHLQKGVIGELDLSSVRQDNPISSASINRSQKFLVFAQSLFRQLAFRQ